MADDSFPVGRSSREESDLVRRIRQGETERFAELIDRYQRHVGRIVGRRVPLIGYGNSSMKSSSKRTSIWRSFRTRCPLNIGWLASPCAPAYDFWRARAREDVPVSALSEDHQRWIEQTLSSQSDRQFRDQTAKQEAADVLEWALRQLSPENRAVLTLVHLDGYSVREAAQLLGGLSSM
jgi:RNA polymerase sigma-70 factor (ECF subfamily)